MTAFWIGPALAVLIGGGGIERRPSPEDAELLPLADGGLLVWNDRGQAALRSAAGKWTDEFRLPLQRIWRVASDGPGFLATGSARDGNVVVLFDGQARELRRWRVFAAIFQLFVDGGRRWMVDRTGMAELFADGRVGPLEPFSDGEAARRHSQPPRVFGSGHSRWICWGSDRTEAHDAPASCQAPDGDKWYLPRARREPPIRCGDWIVDTTGDDPRDVKVWSLQAKSIAQRHFPSAPAVACSDDGEVVVGGRDVVQVLKLPSLAPVWTRRVRGVVHAVAAWTGAVAYRGGASPAVVVVPR